MKSEFTLWLREFRESMSRWAIEPQPCVRVRRSKNRNKDTADILRYTALFPQSFNFSRYCDAASSASSTFSGLVPLPTLVGALPPAFPPTMLETVAAQSVEDAPCLLIPCKHGENQFLTIFPKKRPGHPK